MPEEGTPEAPHPGDAPQANDEQDDLARAFAFLSLEGDRFNAEGMPADAAKEIAAYREALVTIAGDLWKKANGAKKVPNGFDAAFDLRLTRVRGGSAQPVLILNHPVRGVTQTEWDDWVQFYEQARDVATAGVADVASADAVPLEMSPVVRRALKKVGATLEATERMTVGAPARSDAPAPARSQITARVHQLLKETLESPPDGPRAATAIGVLSKYDGEGLSFLMRTEEHAPVLCVLEHFNEPLAQKAREYLAIDGVTAPDVRVEGETQDIEGRVRRIYNVHALEIVWTVDEKVVVHRLRALTKLKPGWLGPGTDVPPVDVATSLEAVVPVIATMGTEVGIVATGEGAVVLDWRLGDVVYTAQVDPDGTLFMCTDNVVTDELRELERPYEPAVLINFLRSGAMQ